MAPFTHLHVASAHSTHHGTAWPEQLAAQAAADGATALALTDRDGLYGAVRHITACQRVGLSPIVGAELTVLAPDRPASQITVLAHGHDGGAGWASLARSISAAHHRRPAAGADRTGRRGPAGLAPDRLGTFLLGPDGPTGTVLLGPDSDVGQALLAGHRSLAEELARGWRRRLGPALAVEAVCHHTRPGAAASLSQAAELLELARHCGLEAVLSNAVRYLRADDAITGDVLDAADRLQPLGSFTPQANGQAWLKPAAAMSQIAADLADQAGLPAAAGQRLLESTERLAERCRIDPAGDLGWGRPKLPELSVLGLRGDPARLLAQRCRQGLPELYPQADRTARERLRQRLDSELDTIASFGFETYFLTVADVVDLIRRLGVRVQARGSGVSSLVNYLLRVSSVDPLEHDLVFARFLSRDRSTLPDIDLDVESTRRHDIYRAIFARYGQHRVALLAMTNRYRSRQAARDAGLALGLDESRIDRSRGPGRRGPDARSADPGPPEPLPLSRSLPDRSQLGLLADLSQRLDRLPRHVSTHPCGVILGDAQLLSLTPVQPAGNGLPMSQFDKDDVDGLGLLKLDVLGVRMQSTLAYARSEIARCNGPQTARAGGLPPTAAYIDQSGSIDLERLPHDDAATFETIRSAHTLGLSQIESPGQRELIGQLQPDQYEDLIADLALFRPGPLRSDMVTPYLEAKQGWRQPDPLHPRFQAFLRDSYGVVVYHEHILRILHDCMGVSLDQADQLRRALAARPGPVEAAFRRRTAARLDDQGRRLFSDRQIDRVWATLAAFGSFGFCKAHAAALACTTWQSAWLKTHYPAEFLAALFEHDPGMYPRRLLVAEARRLGIPILPLDANASSDHYRVEPGADGKAIRLSFRDVRGITAAETGRILAGQPYDSILDFVSRARPSRRLADRLAAVGVFDQLTDPAQPLSRGDITAYVRRLTARLGRLRPQPHQPPLLADELAPVLTDPAPAQPRLFDDGPQPDPEPDPRQRAAVELAVLSTEIERHVIACHDPLLNALAVTPADRLLELRNDSEVLVAGARVATRTTPWRAGRRAVFVSLDDGSGCADGVFFESAQRRAEAALWTAQLLLVRGRTRRTGARGVSLRFDRVWDLKTVWADWSRAPVKSGFRLPA
ncbi:MAG: PHP domain-containing protein [Propionibacteriaceae bacterium]|jgi:error-prone DNA polymerase|nr:PHP domain-containing protein [Propionibacteriaceae bacterium]